MPLRPQRAGAFDRRVTVQAVSVAGADNTETPADLFTAWAKYDPVTGSEQFRTGQRLASETAIFTLRWRSDWTPAPGSHRIVYGGRTWDVRYVSEVGRHDAHELTCEVVGTTGGG
jgi:SPP1 family predicted phage head-tail adaptor